MNLRQDTGNLWECYLLNERIKRNTYLQEQVQYFFWRNYNQQEIDLIELKQGQLHAYEFKYSNNKRVKVPAAFSTAYPGASFECITKDNYLDWITRQ